MWLGEKITDKGIGNGISLIITETPQMSRSENGEFCLEVKSNLAQTTIRLFQTIDKQ
jgi:preprotein translocase subunit SecY